MLTNPHAMRMVAIALQALPFPLIPNRDGNVLFVDSVNGSGRNSGHTPQEALATMDQATNKCRANKGDIVIALPGHAETIGATSWVPDIAGVSYLGMGRGGRKPTLTFNAAGSTLPFSAANQIFSGFSIRTTGTIDVAVGINLTGVGCIVHDVDVRENAATSQTVLPLVCAAADLLIDGYRFLGAAGDATVTGLRMTAADRLEVRNCKIIGNFQGSVDATGAIQSLTTANLEIDIHHNRVDNRDGTSEAGIVFVATDTGLVWENFIAVPTGDFGQGLILDSLMRQFNNYVVDVAAERGAPEGTASA